MQQALKHLKIAASDGCFNSMHYFHLITSFEQSLVSRESIDSTLEAYNNSGAEMRSEARDTFISIHINNIGVRWQA
jgi:predicted neutral ceramidase superfamily lipid hydrolase